MDGSDWVRLILLVFALMASAFFSASEAAYLSIQRSQLAALMKTNPKQWSRIDRLASHPEKLLSTVLTGNNLANTAAAALATGLFLSFLGPDAAVIASTIVITVLLLIFAEAIPKTMATRYSVGLASKVSIPLRIVEAVLLPPIWVLERLVRGVTAILGLPKTAIVSGEEIKALIEMGHEAGSVEPAQAELLGQVFRIGDQRLRDIMTHRTEVVTMEKGDTLEKFMEVYHESPYTHYPVCEGSIDNICGILSLKDVMSVMAASKLDPGDDVTLLMKPAYVLPENRELGSLIRQMQENGHELVILADEYGGVTGMVTFKQMVEEIVGVAEHGIRLTEEELEVIQADGYLVAGDLHIDDANERIDMEIPEGDYETVAGFMLTNMGVIPQAGERMTHNDFILEVVRVDGFKVEEVKITRTSQLTNDGE